MRIYEVNQTNTAVATPASQPQRVKIPVPLSIREGYLEVREVETDILVTTIEILSPSSNKRSKGRKQYEEKRE